MKISKANIVLFIFIVNAIVSITSAFQIYEDIHSGIIRAGIVAIAMPFLLTNLKMTKTIIMILVTVIYLTISFTTNTRVIESFPILIGVVFSLLMFPFAYNYIYKIEHLQKLSRLVILLLFAFGLHFIWAQLFQVGRLPYENYGGAFYTGGGGVHQTFIIVYLLLFLPFVFKIYPKQIGWFELSAIVLSLLPVLLIFRRGSILGLLFGLIIYTIFNFKKIRFFKIAVIVSLIGMLIFPFYYSEIESHLERRPIDITDTEAIEQIGRTQEIISWAPYWMEEKGISHTLFGSELYDYQQLAGVTRSLHSDYAAYLIGAGIIGFILYFSIIIFITLDFRRSLYYIKNRIIRKELTSILSSLMAAYLVISYSGQYYVISALSTVMFLLGVLNRYVTECE